MKPIEITENWFGGHMKDLEIIEVEGKTSLYNKYDSQTSRQPCYVELECPIRRLSADWDGEIGGAVPFHVYHGHTQRWGIPALTSYWANKLLEELKPLAIRVCDGYSEEWDGHNKIAVFDDDAKEAIDEIEAIIATYNDDPFIVHAWDAADWYAEEGKKSVAESFGLTANTTDEQLRAIIKRAKEEAEATDECDRLERAEQYFEELRATLREELKFEVTATDSSGHIVERIYARKRLRNWSERNGQGGPPTY